MFVNIRIRRSAIYVAAGLLVIYAVWLAYTWPTTVQWTPSFAVAYSRGLGQTAVLEVVNETGHHVHFCATLFGWFPNGSIVELDWKCGKGSTELDVEAIRRYAAHWRELDGEVGIIALLTYINGTDKSGNYTVSHAAKSFTIAPREVLNGKSIKAKIIVRGKAATPKESQQRNPEAQWPPREIEEGCISIQWCYIWVLEQVHYSVLDAPIPVVVARVRNSVDARFIQGVSTILVGAVLSGASVYFSGGAAIRYGGSASTEYSADIYTLRISDRRFQLEVYESMAPSLSGPGLVAVGFYGDYAFATYRLYIVLPRTERIVPTETRAQIYLVRPSSIPPRAYSEIAPLGSHLDNLFSRVASMWNARYHGGGSTLVVSSLVTVEESLGIDILAIAIPLLRTAPGLDANLVASIGVDTQYTALGIVGARLLPEYENNYRYFLYGQYYVPNVLFEYRGGYYAIPSLYVDVSVGAGLLDREPES